MWLWLLLACTSPCPPGLAPDDALESALREQLGAHPLSAPLTEAPLRACFGAPPEPAVDTEGRLLLPLNDAEALAPRAAHLLLHRERGLSPEAPCAQVRAAEAEAIALEVNLREAMGQPPALPGEVRLRELSPGQRAAHVAERWRGAPLHGTLGPCKPPDGAPP